jgi:hypothetical protein
MINRKSLLLTLAFDGAVSLPAEAKKRHAQPKPAAAAAEPKQFTVDPAVNEQMARKLNIPVFFAVPASARLPLTAGFNTTDRLVDFKHPEASATQGDVGLRLIVTKRDGMVQRLGKSGLVQAGDILLSMRPEWGGAGAYPNVQMGITHSGVAYIKDGVLHNIDNPMDSEFLGSKLNGDLNGKHYQTRSLSRYGKRERPCIERAQLISSRLAHRTEEHRTTKAGLDAGFG